MKGKPADAYPSTLGVLPDFCPDLIDAIWQLWTWVHLFGPGFPSIINKKAPIRAVDSFVV